MTLWLLVAFWREQFATNSCWWKRRVRIIVYSRCNFHTNPRLCTHRIGSLPWILYSEKLRNRESFGSSLAVLPLFLPKPLKLMLSLLESTRKDPCVFSGEERLLQRQLGARWRKAVARHRSHPHWVAADPVLVGAEAHKHKHVWLLKQAVREQNEMWYRRLRDELWSKRTLLSNRIRDTMIARAQLWAQL